MKVIGLDGKSYSLSFAGKNEFTEEKSSYHLLARKILTDIFKPVRILEEVYLPGCGGLYADFFIPIYKTLIEAHGPQHYKFTPYFHASIHAFRMSKKRDEDKKRFCEINNIKFVELPYNEDENEWRKRIANR